MKRTYEKVTKDEMILRDHLALDRTILANERTFLSYIRTTLALVVVGSTLLHFTDEAFLTSLGVLAILLGIAILIVGVKRTLSMSQKIYGKKRK